MHEHQVALARELQGAVERAVVVIAVQHHLGAKVEDRLHLDVGSGLRHDDHRGDAAAVRGERHALGVIAGGGAHHAATGSQLGQVSDAVVGAAQLEREHRLQVLALEQHAVPEPAREPCRKLEGRFDGDVVDARLENSLDVGTRHPPQLSGVP